MWQNLFELGARKFAILGVPPIGCCPFSRLSDDGDHCHKEMNEYARDFQTTLGVLLQKLSSEYREMKYSLGNAYEMTMNIIEDPHKFSKCFAQKGCHIIIVHIGKNIPLIRWRVVEMALHSSFALETNCWIESNFKFHPYSQI